MRPALAVSQPLLAWLRDDPAWRQLPWSTRAGLAWRARLGSWNAGLSAQLAPARSLPEHALFILGPWRSGSTVMHELLHAALGWPTPRTWQCMDPTAFQLQRAPRRDTPVARPMDGLALGALSPQEDEFALLGLGVDSAYRGFWMPHRLDALHHTLDPAHWQQQADWLSVWGRFVGAIQGPHPQVLLKSPNHSFRWPAFVAALPQAKAVWMLRDGASVFASNRKMWRQMTQLHGLTEVEPAALDRFLAAALRRCAEILASNDLPDNRFATCHQERLRQQPAAEVRRLVEQLQLSDRVDEAALAAAVARTASGRIDAYAPLNDLDADVQAAIQRFDEAQQRVDQPAI
ncbi:MAG: sulfotransferase [Inhella sp.]|jgi:hypothetical protein|uniref:sulfotransferase family protein n=1 Tax=Inhella sp. TaxID=1921806 RepID=UPI0022BECE38|nr:sulfotransferase [Inhella sp.]MCZ8234450.1 sulfotransferase [Inhella sp.]